MYDFMDWAMGIIIGISIVMLSYMLVLLIAMGVNQPKAIECIRSGGEPYYFVTKMECKQSINVNVAEE